MGFLRPLFSFPILAHQKNSEEKARLEVKVEET
jgi:hypothetical protein